MRYRIIANPVAGRMPAETRRALLARAAAILNADINGLETRSADAFSQCARQVASECDVMVVAGGDGTFSQVFNTLGDDAPVLAYLPFGTGNALSHALGCRGGVAAAAHRIRSGRLREVDLVNCDDRRRGFLVSLGIDGSAIARYERMTSGGRGGLGAHVKAAVGAYFRDYRAPGARVTIDGRTDTVSALLSLLVVKQPYYGFGLKMVPEARWDDGRLHALWLTDDIKSILLGAASAATVGNRAGRYRPGRRVAIELKAPVTLQIDGEACWRERRFRFSVLPKALKIKC
jgi:diacylglycerol kinase (ATP)